MNDPDLDGLWVRHLAGEQLRAEDAERLLIALRTDTNLRDRYLADRALEGALRQSGRPSTADHAFARHIGEILLADRDGEQFVASFRKRMLRHPGSHRSRRSPGRPRAWMGWAAAVIIAGLLIPGLGVLGHAGPPPLGHVADVTGSVILVRGRQKLRIRSATDIIDGDCIATADVGHATFTYVGEDTTVVMTPGTRLALATIRGGKHLSLSFGSLACEVAPQPPGHPLVLETPQATITVIGTGFTLTASSERSRLVVIHGLVKMTGRNGESVEVAAGNFAECTTGALASGIVEQPGTSRLTSPISHVQPSAQAHFRASSRQDGLVGHWTFDEGRGVLAHDTSGGGHDGTLIGGAAWGPGRIGGALVLDGRTGYVEVPSCAALDLDATNDAFTLAVWIKTTRPYQPILAKGRPSGRLDDIPWILQVSFSTSHDLTLWRWHDQPGLGSHGKLWRFSVEQASIHDGQWHQVTYVNRTRALRELYVDGQLVGTDTVPWTISCRNDEPMDIGRYSNPLYQAPLFFQGSIDDLRIYHRALAMGGILQLAHPMEPKPGTKAAP